MTLPKPAPKVFIRTYGCQMNEYDSARMAEVLAHSHGYERTQVPEDADLLLINTCSVREKAQEKVFSEVGRWKGWKAAKPGRVIGVGGCVASQEGAALIARAPVVDVVFGPQTLHRLPELLEQARATRAPAIDVTFPEIEKFDRLPEPRAEGPTAFVSIMEGCSKYCTFCVVPYTRGEEVSRPFESVLDECRRLVEQGVREITLLGQNVNAYRGPMSDGTVADLALLVEYLAALDGLERIRFTTSHPVEFGDSLIEAFAAVPKLASYLHLPVQSGSDRILAMMKRGHTRAQYLDKIRRVRAVRPDLSLSSDFIVGFPGETEDDFRATLDLIEEAQFDCAFSFIYSPRPGTPAANLRDGIGAGAKHERLARLQARIRAHDDAFKRSLVGTTQCVLVERPAPRGGGRMAGRTSTNRWVNFDGPESLVGTFVDVTVTEALNNSLRGRVTTLSPTPLPQAGEGHCDDHLSRLRERSAAKRTGEGVKAPAKAEPQRRLDLVLEPDDAQRLANLSGPFDAHLRQIELRLGIEIRNRGNRFRLLGPETEINRGEEVLRKLFEQTAEALVTTEQVHLTLAEEIGEPATAKAAAPDVDEGGIVVRTKRGVVRGRSERQREYLRDIATHDLTFGVGPAGTGKCIAASSLVLTDCGLLPIGALGAGMRPDSAAPIDIQAAGLDGIERVSHVYDGGVTATRRIRTRLGLGIEATPEHPLLQLRPDGSLVWTRTDQLGPGDFIAVQRGQNLFGSDTTIRHQYQRNGPQDHAKRVHLEQLDEEAAYILGALTGDGCLTYRNRVILSTADEAIAERFRRFAARLGLAVFPNGGGRPYDHIIASSQLYQLLLNLGMSSGKAAQKRIPHAVLRAPRPIVAAFLRGLFDTDGTVSRRDGYPSLCSASERLIAEVQIVLLNFGILAARRQRRVAYKGQNKTYHELEMRGVEAQRFYDEIGFGLERKQQLRMRLRANTNVDVLPHVAPLLDAAIRGLSLSRALHKRLGDYRSGRRHPSYPKLAEFMGLLAAAQASAAYSRLKELLGRRLFWAEIVDAEAGEAQVFDLTVPGSHSFCANGFVNHNTYLAVASAVQALEQDRVRRIVLTRPAVEAGEKLGFLPGDMAQKVDPYLRPLYDALYEMLGFERVARLVERAVIEVAPLAYMRGRAQPYFSRVLTPKGWRPIGTLEPGDSVIGSDGRPTEVLGVFPQGRREVFRVTAQDGASTLCCGEHLWTVYTPKDRERGTGPRTLETRAMIGRLRQHHQHRFELPLLSAPALFPPRYVPMDPYALGLVLGDGCITGKTTPSFTTADPELAAALQRELQGIELAAKSRIDYVLRNVAGGRGGLRIPNPVTVTLRELQLCGAASHTKFVPKDYLYNAPEVRLGVLQGLLDTDGGPVTQDGRTCRTQYTTTSPQLRDDVVFLVRSLGGVAYWRTRHAAGRKPGRAKGRDVGYCHDAYVVDIRLPARMAPFRLRRKAEAYAKTGGGRPMRYIDSIEPVGVQDVLCIKVAAVDSLYVTDDFLLTHNTLNESFIILDEAQNTSVEQMKMFLTRIGFGSVAVVTGDVTQIDLPRHQTSGLKHTMQVLKGVSGIKFVMFEKKDVVRHPLVQSIVHAYEIHEQAAETATRDPGPGTREKPE